MLRLIKDSSRRSFAVPILVLIFFTNGNAGTGYIDSNGKWNFTVVFYHPTATTLDPIIRDKWADILDLAQSFLYQATSGKNQFGQVKYYFGSFYDPTVDVVIKLAEAHDPRADVYGLNRFGYHVFMSEVWRTSPPKSDTVVAKNLIHELGHYLYSLFDEYRNTASAIPVRQCINDSVTSFLGAKVCFMEKDVVNDQTWCHPLNHELENGFRYYDTWQSEATTTRESCWQVMKRIQSTSFAGAGITPADPSTVLPLPPSIAPLVLLTPHIEIIVAVEADIMDDVNLAPRMNQMLTHLFASPPATCTSGHVAFVVFKGNTIAMNPMNPMTSPICWDFNLITTYTSILNNLRVIVGNPAPTQTNLDNLTNIVKNLFDQLASAGGTGSGVPRIFLFLTRGSDTPLAASMATTDDFKKKNVRTSIGFFQPQTGVVASYLDFARAINATFYFSNAPEVLAYQGIDAASRQAIFFQTVKTSPGSPVTFSFKVPDSLAQANVSIAWTAPNCGADVFIQEGTDNPVPIVENNERNFVGSAVKGRRYASVDTGTTFTATATILPGCPLTEIAVTFSISGVSRSYFFVGAPERPIYGNTDNHVVHGRVLDPFPIVDFDLFVAGEIDDAGNFLIQVPARLFDDGTSVDRPFIRHGDWVARDGIYSDAITTSQLIPGFHTVKFIVENQGNARLAEGEVLDKGQIIDARTIGLLRREGFATYFVADTVSTLPVAIRVDSVRKIDNNNRYFVKGVFDLAKTYPHAFTIKITANNDSLIVDANQFSGTATLNNSNTVPLKVEVLYRTGDTKQLITKVEERLNQGNSLPEQVQLYSIYPNPFNAATIIAFDLPKRSQVSLRIYDVLGNRVHTIFENKLIEAGHHTITWEGVNDDGIAVSSGIYFVQMRVGNWKQVQKITLMK